MNLPRNSSFIPELMSLRRWERVCSILQNRFFQNLGQLEVKMFSSLQLNWHKDFSLSEKCISVGLVTNLNFLNRTFFTKLSISRLILSLSFSIANWASFHFCATGTVLLGRTLSKVTSEINSAVLLLLFHFGWPHW